MNISNVYSLHQSFNEFKVHVAALRRCSLVDDISVMSNSITKDVTEKNGRTEKITSVHTANKPFSLGSRWPFQSLRVLIDPTTTLLRILYKR